MLTPEMILWIYIVLLFLGGLMGFLKAGSKMSLIMASAFAALLILCNIHIITGPRHIVDFILIFLLLFFAFRLTKSKKFMPNGLMSVLTLATLILLHVHF
jgi:uncharacterized membrane protein (UPF0136 family)